MDAVAQKHDKAYDIANARGAKGALGDLETMSADRQLLSDASRVVGMHTLGIKDPVNHQLISDETNAAAKSVVKIFAGIVIEKRNENSSYKDK